MWYRTACNVPTSARDGTMATKTIKNIDKAFLGVVNIILMLGIGS